MALDLETTGLSPDSEEIIEVGAVKFRGDETVDTFKTFVNPNRILGPFIKRLTGIAQQDVDTAPSFSRVAGELAAFLGDAPIVGHNVAFDLGFLTAKGLRLSNPRTDTWDLAYVMLPNCPDYTLSGLATQFGAIHDRPHRALDDAIATMGVFLRLVGMASDLDVYTLAEMDRLATRSGWVLSYLLRRLEAYKIAASGSTAQSSPGGHGMTGIDLTMLRGRLKRTKSLRPNKYIERVDPDLVESLLSTDGPVAETMDGFEERPEQVAMARAIAKAISEGNRLIVEAGTGVGKSLSYLLSAALYAIKNDARVVVSTNTINLQEQLFSKDVPAMVEALSHVDGVSMDDFKFTILKGRANYLCLKRWSLMRGADNLSVDEARLLSKILVWLRDSPAGDRAEINLSNRRASGPWAKISAQGAVDCSGLNGICFLRTARDRAAGAHLVIVNHALLMSDLATGRALIPDYDVLIIDEAQHLEEVATSHLGFEIGQSSIDDHLKLLGGDSGLLRSLAASFRGSSAVETRRGTIDEVSARIVATLPSVRDSLGRVFAILSTILDDQPHGDPAFDREARITSATRSQPVWSVLEIQWETANVFLSELENDLSALLMSLEGLEDARVLDYEALLLETSNILQRNAELRQHLMEFVPQPESDVIYWLRRAKRSGGMTLYAAPVHIGEHLEQKLYSQKRSVILTSATISTGGTFDLVRERTGFSDADELLVGSPFDYPTAALLCVPADMPEPSSWAYQTAVEQAIVDSTVAAGGSVMALFTSYASLQAAAVAIRGQLQSRGFDVLAQGVDGTPHQLLRRFVENPKTVLLGTSSFWEGVDLAGDALKVLLVARLPFSVPTEPVFAARSELYERPFDEYAVPQAILRLRQGFGRLIRTRTDRGIVVILDRRTVSRNYGKTFIDSLPPVPINAAPLAVLGEEIKTWLRAGGSARA